MCSVILVRYAITTTNDFCSQRHSSDLVSHSGAGTRESASHSVCRHESRAVKAGQHTSEFKPFTVGIIAQGRAKSCTGGRVARSPRSSVPRPDTLQDVQLFADGYGVPVGTAVGEAGAALGDPVGATVGVAVGAAAGWWRCGKRQGNRWINSIYSLEVREIPLAWWWVPIGSVVYR